MPHVLIPHNQHVHSAMVGSKVDQDVFEFLVSNQMPAVYKHLAELMFPLAIVSQPWFLCLFIGFLPMEHTLRFLDCFFAQGHVMLYKVSLSLSLPLLVLTELVSTKLFLTSCLFREQAGLAMFKLVEDKILRAERMEEVFELWKDKEYQPELLRIMLTQYEEYERRLHGIVCTFSMYLSILVPSRLPIAQIEEKKSVALDDAIKSVEDRTKRTILKHLKDVSLFSKEELSDFYGTYRAVSESSHRYCS